MDSESCLCADQLLGSRVPAQQAQSCRRSAVPKCAQFSDVYCFSHAMAATATAPKPTCPAAVGHCCYWTCRGCWNWSRLDGTSTAAERADMIDRFNDPAGSQFLFLLSLRAGGVGLNLQSADTVIMYDTDWNPQIDLQVRWGGGQERGRGALSWAGLCSQNTKSFFVIGVLFFWERLLRDWEAVAEEGKVAVRPLTCSHR